VRGEEIKLPLKEFELLEMLLSNPGRVVTRDTLIDRVWGMDYVGDTKTLDVHIKRLRSRIEQDPSSRCSSRQFAASATGSSPRVADPSTPTRCSRQRPNC